jgi:predicted transposase YdaD
MRCDSMPIRQGIIEVVNMIISYKFTNLSRKEIDAMLGTKFEETRVFQEAQGDKAKAIALKMLRKSMSLETIADITDLTIAQLQELQAQVS